MPTGWILREMKLADLKNHPVDAEIYGDHALDDELLSSIKSNGILDPLVATKDGVILSGHRRKSHGLKAGLKTANVLCARHAMSDDEQIVCIVESNRYREKSVEQKAREFGKLAEAMAALARKRMDSGRKADPKEKLPQGQQVKDQAADQVGMSRPTAEKALEAVHIADEAEAAGDTERATDIRKSLNNDSVSAAHRKAVGAPKPREGNTKLDFDDSVIDGHFGKLIRAVDDRAKCLKCQNSQHHKTALKHLNAFYDDWKLWRKERR